MDKETNDQLDSFAPLDEGAPEEHVSGGEMVDYMLGQPPPPTPGPQSQVSFDKLTFSDVLQFADFGPKLALNQPAAASENGAEDETATSSGSSPCRPSPTCLLPVSRITWMNRRVANRRLTPAASPRARRWCSRLTAAAVRRRPLTRGRAGAEAAPDDQVDRGGGEPADDTYRRRAQPPPADERVPQGPQVPHAWILCPK
ncbi:hypothetical protein GUJ93_ZPchr0846g33715, partial [Zizania palustris]